MDSTEVDTHSFVIKIWREAADDEAGRVIWRGHITHVPDGERRYLKEVTEVVAFIKPYLVVMGVRFGMRAWLMQWWYRLT